MGPHISRQFLLLAALVAGTLAGTDRVPALLWTNDESLKFPDVLAGHTVTTDDFNTRYVKPMLENKILVVFVQDKLSVADISHYADVYGYSDGDDAFTNVKAIMSELPSAHLPNVLSPLAAFDDARLDKQILQAPFNVDTLDLARRQGGGKGGVVIVRLPDTRAGEYRQALGRNDEIIGSVTRQLRALKLPFTAIYTAVKSSLTPDARIASPRRQLLSDSASDDTAYNGSQVFSIGNDTLMYTGGIGVIFADRPENNTWLELDKLVLHDNDSFCDDNATITSETNATCVLVFAYSGSVQSVSEMKFRFEFGMSGELDPGYWSMTRFLLTYVNDTEAVEAEMDWSAMTDWTPVGLSYSCGRIKAVKPRNVTTEGKGIYISFQQLQIQVYGVTNGQFGHYNDCQGFFSVGIWMAIICIAVLIAIVIFGIIMLSSITTMDRYDDPKGKTIIVAAGTD